MAAAAVLPAILVVAAALRFSGIGARSLWVDEANTWEIATSSHAEIVARLANDASPPLYYFLLHHWMAVFGSGEAAMRSLSACIGLALVVAVYRIGRHWISPGAGLWAALVLATSPAQVFYSQQVRMYTLLPLALLVSTHLLMLALEQPSVRRCGAYVVSAALALLTHNFALFIVPVHLALAVGYGRPREHVRRWLAVAVGVGVLYLPWLPTLVHQVTAPDTYSWFATTWERWGIYEPVVRTLGSFSPEGRDLVGHGYRATPLQGATAVLYGVGALVGACRLLFGEPVGKRGAGAWLLTLLVLAPTASIVASHVFVPNYVPGRIGQAVIPAFALLLGAAVAGTRSRAARYVTLGVAVALQIVGVWTILANHPVHGRFKEANCERALAAELRTRLVSGDTLLFTSISRPSLEYHVRDSAATFVSRTFPRYNAIHMGGVAGPEPPVSEQELYGEAVSVLDELVRSTAVGSELHVVHLVVPVTRILPEALSRRDLRPVGPELEFTQAITGRKLRLLRFQVLND